MTLLLLCLQGKAQGFINLTAQEVRIDSVLPAYTFQKPLGLRYADSTYTVSIEYPEFIDIQRLHFHLDINGKTVQEGCTSDMLYKVDEIIAYISQFFTLKTGDLLYTGTPAGVGPVHIDDHLEGWLEQRKVLAFNCK